ncbi:hypothetical protein AAY473_040061 [Plecturocebus cupreus]
MQAPKILADLAPENPLPITPPPYQEERPLSPEPEISMPPQCLNPPRPPRVEGKGSASSGGTSSIAAHFSGGSPSLVAHLWPKTVVQMPLREQQCTEVHEDGHMMERRVFTYVPFTSSNLINWKNNNPS